jgi:hypothetical protein
MRQSCQRRIAEVMAVSRSMLQPVMLPMTSSAKWRPMRLSRKSRIPIISSSLSARMAALMAAEVALGVEKQTGTPVIIEAAILQRVLEAHVRQHLDALADLRVSLG